MLQYDELNFKILLLLHKKGGR